MRFLGAFLILLSLGGVVLLVMIYQVGSIGSQHVGTRTFASFLAGTWPIVLITVVLFITGLAGVFKIFGPPSRSRRGRA